MTLFAITMNNNNNNNNNIELIHYNKDISVLAGSALSLALRIPGSSFPELGYSYPHPRQNNVWMLHVIHLY